MDFYPEEAQLKLREWDKEVEHYQLLRIAKERTAARPHRSFLPTLGQLNPTASVAEAARLLIQHRIGALPVVEQHWLVGLLTQDDILRTILVEHAEPSLVA